MIRVRLHGRGGQGMKTAGRIIGSAAFRAGWTVQDSPVYGAERRGAPMCAFVRIDRAPIRERGAIAVPDLVVVADDTLLDDAAAAPLAGAPPDAILVVSTAHTADAVARRARHGGPVIARDFAAGPAPVSTALAAIAAALLGLPWAAVEGAVREELPAVGVPAATLEPAVDAAHRVWSSLAPAGIDVDRVRPGLGAGELVDLAWAPAERAAPTVSAGANTPLRRTGSWRTMRPEIALERCTRCWVCFVRCPDAAIALDDADYPHVDYDVCKGCLICVEECPTGAIQARPEVRQWDEGPAP